MPARPTNETNNYIAFGTQSAKDTEASTFYFPKHLTGSGFDVQTNIVSEREGGDGQEIGLRYKSDVKSNGAIVAKSRAQILGLLGKAVLGVDVASTIASGVLNFHRQTFGATLPYLTVDQRWADEVERTTNCKVTQLDITAEAGKPWELSANFLSGGSSYQRDTASALTPARESVPPHYYQGGSYVLTVAGSQTLKLTKWKASLKRNVDDGIQTTGLNPEDAVELNAEFDVDGTFKYEDRGIWQQIEYTGGSQIPFDIATGTFDGYTDAGDGGNASYSARINFPLLQFADIKVNRLDPDGKTIYADFSAMTIKNATTPVFIEQTVGGAASAAY